MTRAERIEEAARAWLDHYHFVDCGTSPCPHHACALLRALAAPVEAHGGAPLSTNDFYVNGLKVGKRVGFGLGLEAAVEFLKGHMGSSINTGTLINIRALASSKLKEET